MLFVLCPSENTSTVDSLSGFPTCSWQTIPLLAARLQSDLLLVRHNDLPPYPSKNIAVLICLYRYQESIPPYTVDKKHLHMLELLMFPEIHPYKAYIF